MTELGNRLFDARQNLGLTQKQVADEILVTAQAVSSWERGESMPNLDKLADLARMDRTSAERYLSTVFLKHLDSAQSDKSAIAAAKACQKEYESRTVGVIELRDFYDYAKDHPVLETLGLPVVREAGKVC